MSFLPTYPTDTVAAIKIIQTSSIVNSLSSSQIKIRHKLIRTKKSRSISLIMQPETLITLDSFCSKGHYW